MMRSTTDLMLENKTLKEVIKNLRATIRDLKEGWDACIEQRQKLNKRLESIAEIKVGYGLRKHPNSTRKDPDDNLRICPACDLQEFRLDEDFGAWVCDSCGHQLEQGEF